MIGLILGRWMDGGLLLGMLARRRRQGNAAT
jgi:hypothetical protein